MYLKVSTFLNLLVFISIACAFAIPLESGTGPAVVSKPSEIVANAPMATQTVQAPIPTEPIPPPIPTPEAFEPIILPISVYILDDEDGQFSSARTAEQLKDIYEKVNEIWASANILIEVQSVQRISVPPVYLGAIASQDFPLFFSAVRDGKLNIPNPSLLNGFYMQSIGGPNGITPLGSRAFFVTDFPSVYSERVSSHEIGHILGLHHVLIDSNRLLFSGTNGMLLSEEEIIVARYAAKGLLNDVR